MGKPKDPKPKKVRPKERGERWKLVDGLTVTVLSRVGKGFIRCLLSSGMMGVYHENVFMKKEN